MVYGVAGYKLTLNCVWWCVAKLVAHRYAHLGTGNYHAGTARLYTDFGLFTANAAITEDLHKIFHMLTGLGRIHDLKHLLASPFTLHTAVIAKIQREIDTPAKGKQP